MSNPKFNAVTFLDSTINSENSITGFNFTNTLPSPSYPSGYFKNSNAVTIPSSLSAGEQIANTSVTVSKEGAMGMWFNPNGWGLINTNMSGDTFNTIIGRGYWGVSGVEASNETLLAVAVALNLLY